LVHDSPLLVGVAPRVAFSHVVAEAAVQVELVRVRHDQFVAAVDQIDDALVILVGPNLYDTSVGWEGRGHDWAGGRLAKIRKLNALLRHIRLFSQQHLTFVRSLI
jgi:hypothetical protein